MGKNIDLGEICEMGTFGTWKNLQNGGKIWNLEKKFNWKKCVNRTNLQNGEKFRTGKNFGKGGTNFELGKNV